MQETPPVPSVLAMLLCDRVITEAGTNKKSLIGTFDRLRAPLVPASIGGFWVYARLTDCEGKYVFRIRFAFLNDDKLLAEAVTNETSISSRLAVAELAFPVPPLPVEKTGVYEVQLFANEVYIGRTTVAVELVEAK